VLAGVDLTGGPSHASGSSSSTASASAPASAHHHLHHVLHHSIHASPVPGSAPSGDVLSLLVDGQGPTPEQTSILLQGVFSSFFSSKFNVAIPAVKKLKWKYTYPRGW